MPAIPPACAALQVALTNAEAHLAELDRQLNADPPPAADVQRQLVQRLVAAARQRDSAQLKLDACVRDHGPPPTPVAPTLAVSRIEVTSSVQTRTNAVRLVRGRSAIVRVFVSSGVDNGYDAGYGPNRVAGVTGRIRIVDALSGADLFTNPTPLNGNGGLIVAQPAGSTDRNERDHSLNFRVPANVLTNTDDASVEARVFVSGREGDGGGWVADGSVRVQIPARRAPQVIIPVLIGVPAVNGGVPPTMSEFTMTLRGALTRFPIPTFDVQRPGTVTTTRDLTTRDGWDGLLVDINSWAGFGSQARGIIAGLVPFGAYNGIGGIGIQRVFFSNQPKFVSVPDPETFAHEMGHAFGIRHANCGGPAGPFDPRLPVNGRSDEPGVDVNTGDIIPANAGEIQSYCSDRWPSVATYNIVYDNMPI